MRTSRCILYTVMVTLGCLLYVFQQTEIVKLGYRMTAAKKVLETHLDRKLTLEYSVSKLESPHSLEKGLSLNKDGFQIAQDYKLVKLAGSGAAGNRRASAVSRNSVFKRFVLGRVLTQGASAEARTLK